MKLASMLVGLSAAASAIAFTAAPAHAFGPGKVDGTVDASSLGTTCTWVNANTTDMPPNTLTIDHTTISTSCTGSVVLTVSSSPTVTFSGTTATIGQIDVSVTSPLSCSYRVSNAALSQTGTNTYTGTNLPAVEKDPKRFLCPDNVTIDSVTLAFHS